ncbi:hypothetical protein [Paenarthrobacter aurescens]|uniref:hypothetical protein n=1 Tax=Paenarthrobacter aurescens TaxID=43663 RepID=UPI0035E8F449
MAFRAVAGAGAMIIGALLDHDGAATGIGIGSGLVLAGLGDILPSLGVLAAMAAFLLLCGAWLLRRSLQRAL